MVEMSMRESRIIFFLIIAAVVASCATERKIERMRTGEISAKLALTREQDFIPDIDKNLIAKRDTLKVTDLEGNEVILMKAIKDEDGEMIAHDVLDAAVVTARFRNIAERHGKVDLEFQVIVPQEMQDSRWQLRFYPDMYILEDSIRLESVIITGNDYRRSQLKGYQQYERFLSTIVTDTMKFVNMWQLEIFIQRNIPELYAFKSDSTYVSDEQFASVYGVTEKQAIEHYTNKLARKMNERRKSRREKMYRRYVKAPIIRDGLRLDTVMQAINGDFVYNYVQTISTRPKLRKVDIVLSGGIYDQEQLVYRIPRSEPLTFYISSLSAFVDPSPRYKTMIVERRAEANTACYIDFAQGKHEVDDKLGNNAEEIGRIKGNLESLMNNTKFDLDSIVISAYASPEGSSSFNDRLAYRRSVGISDYFSKWMTHYQDSLDAEKGFSVDIDGNIVKEERMKIPFTGHSLGENWNMLDVLVEKDTLLDESAKKSYRKYAGMADKDRGEYLMQKEPYYRHLREKLYPRLRTVRFDFYLHRKGMVKDTVHTTVIDSTYMDGVQAIRDRNYERALTLLRPYNDYNTAIAYVSLDYNASAMNILERLEKTAQVNYMLAVLYSRKGDDQNAVQCYLHACRQDGSYVHRGNLDPEIAALIKRYDLNKAPEDEFEYSF